MKTPSSRNYNSFRNWVWDRKPLVREESRFMQHGDDLVALADGQEDGCFDGMVEDALGWLPRSLIRVPFPIHLAPSIQTILNQASIR